MSKTTAPNAQAASPPQTSVSNTAVLARRSVCFSTRCVMAVAFAICQPQETRTTHLTRQLGCAPRVKWRYRHAAGLRLAQGSGYAAVTPPADSLCGDC